MRRHQHDSLAWLEFELLADLPRIKHGVLLRQGGQSQGSYASLNMSPQVGDQEAAVQANLQRFERHLQQEILKEQHQVLGIGCHGTYVASIEKYAPQQIAACDGVMTALPQLTLCMRHADCQIALLYDPKLHVAANIHAGWRGSIKNIFGIAIRQMQQIFGSKPANLLACISPSLGPEKAEFIHYQTEIPKEFWSFQIRPTYFDFWALSEEQLKKAGILPHHIEIARLCTYENAADFFSYRRDKLTGRHISYLTLL